MPSTGDNRIRVNKGQVGAPLGVMMPEVHMYVRHGNDYRWIKSLVSGNTLMNLALTSGGTVVGQAYTKDLMIDVTVASGFGWPTGGQTVVFGHSGVWPQGVPNGSGNLMVYKEGEDGGRDIYGPFTVPH